MQRFCISTLTLTKSGCKNSAELHFANFIIKTTSINVSKCAEGINEQLLKTSGFDVLSSRKKLQTTLEGGATSPPSALISPRVKLEFPTVNFSLRKQPSLLRVIV